MYRKIEDTLKKWKNDPEHLPLIVRGARQVGKSYSILKFAKANYNVVLEINFERNEDAKAQFESSIDPDDILSYLQLRYTEKLKGESFVLLFLDEIQACPRALTSLKFLASECPYDIIASGSLLGVAIAASTSFPVGYVKTIDLYPMDFEEYLYANSVTKDQIETLKKYYVNEKPVPEGIHKIYLQHLKNYVLCGGMPAVVRDFVKYKDFTKVRERQQQIMKDYYEDMAKYAQPFDKVKVHECFTSIPLQLGKENKKFQYKLIKNGGSARHYEGSLQWLKDSGLILQCYRLKTIDQPLAIQKELNIFKVYLFDTGLLLSQLSPEVSTSIYTDEAMIYKGAVYENLVAQILAAKGYPLYYFEPSTRSEIDFILDTKNGIPIEVKSSHNTTSKSLKAYVEKYQPSFAYKFSMNNIGSQGCIKQFPLYMLMFLSI